MSPFVWVGAIAIASGLMFTWAARAFAWRVGLMDRPDGRRKIQSMPVAVVGGLALFASTSFAVLVACFVSDEVFHAVSADFRAPLALFAAGGIIAAVGMADDIFNLRARHKLIGQFAAIAILIAGGDFLIEGVSLFGGSVPLGRFAVPVTILWFLGAVNALNLLDGMDGMLGSVGAMICACLGAMAFEYGHPMEGFMAIAMAGGLLAFLRFNLPPASVYLGDCGSMLVGLTIAALATRACLKGPTLAIASPLALLILPFTDTAAAIVRRKLTGRGIAVGDRGHLHHVLQNRGLTRARTLILIAALTGIASIGALTSTVLHNDFAALASALAIAAILVSSGLFGTAELRLIRERGRGIFSNLRGRSAPVEMEVRLQGEADWAEVWNQITEQAEELNLASVFLDVNAPVWHEGYHRRWTRKDQPGDALSVWRVDLPLLGHGQLIGRLSVSGSRDRECIAEKLMVLSRIVARAETLASEIARAAMASKSGVYAPILPIASAPLSASA